MNSGSMARAWCVDSSKHAENDPRSLARRPKPAHASQPLPVHQDARPLRSSLGHAGGTPHHDSTTRHPPCCGVQRDGAGGAAGVHRAAQLAAADGAGVLHGAAERGVRYAGGLVVRRHRRRAGQRVQRGKCGASTVHAGVPAAAADAAILSQRVRVQRGRRLVAVGWGLLVLLRVLLLLPGAVVVLLLLRLLPAERGRRNRARLQRRSQRPGQVLDLRLQLRIVRLQLQDAPAAGAGTTDGPEGAGGAGACSSAARMYGAPTLPGRTSHLRSSSALARVRSPGVITSPCCGSVCREGRSFCCWSLL